MPQSSPVWAPRRSISTTTYITDQPVFQLTNGYLVVVYKDGNGDLRFRITDSVEAFTVADITVTTDSLAPGSHSGAALPDGGFIVAYRNVNGIRLQEYSATGSALPDSTVVASNGAPDAGDTYFSTAIAVSSATSVLIVYTRFDAGTDSYYLEGRLYNPVTNTYGAQFNILPADSSFIDDPEIAVLTNGSYVIVAPRGAGDDSISYKIIGPTGTSITGVRVVTGTDTNGDSDLQPAVAALAGGGFVITWVNVDSNDRDILYSVYSASGTQIATGIVDPAGSLTNNNNYPSVAALRDGRFAIVFQDNQMDRARIELFSATGVSQGIFDYDTTGANYGAGITAVGLEDGRIAVSGYQQAAGVGVTLQLLDLRDTPNADGVYTPEQQIVGTIGNDVIVTDAGTDRIDGWDGDDTITEGAAGTTEIYGGNGNDRINVTSAIAADLWSGGLGIDTIDWSGSAASGATFDLVNGTATQGTAGEAMTGFENLIGTANADIIFGDLAANQLFGGGGNDDIIGGGGDDILLGQDGNDTLSGGLGVNQLSGGLGNDVYVVANSSDTIFEAAGEGTDTVETDLLVFTLPANVENLTATGNEGGFVGIGNAGNNVLTGRTANDILAGLDGNDTLIGGTGSNEMIGGTGNDIYVVTANAPIEAVLNSLIEYGGEGTDEVRATSSVFSLEWYGASELERLTMTNNANHGAVIGNAFGNVITGGTGVDEIFGRAGNDTLIGGTGSANAMYGQEGDDTYIVQAVGDSVIEFLNDGNDTVQAAVASFTLGANVENLIFTSNNTDRIGVGNDLGNTIRGLGGADSLNGAGGDDVIIGNSGADTLQGGSGADQFRYEGGESGIDRILDFVSGTDRIALSNAFFTPTATVAFVSGAGAIATSANSTFLYDTNTGIVSYDDDGNGAGAAIAIAQLNFGQTVVAGDFIFV